MKTVFVSYSRKDSFWLNSILRPLRHLEESGRLQFYVDRERLQPGSDFDLEFETNIEIADGFLILLDRDYLASKFVREREWPKIRRRLENARNQLGEVQLFWLRLKPDYAPGDDPAGICKVLSGHQTAYGLQASLQDLLRNQDEYDQALLQFHTAVEMWLHKETNPPRKPAVPHLEEPAPARTRKFYLDMMRDYYGDIPIGSLGTKREHILRLPLSEVYVEIDTMTLEDRKQARYLFDELAEEAIGKEEEPERGNIIAKILQERGPRLSQSSAEPDTGSDRATSFEELFARERVLVILGDPGSGKSVLCRWVVFQACQSQREGTGSEFGWLGEPRLPILFRTARFAEYIRDREYPTGDEVLEFMDEHLKDVPFSRKAGLSDHDIGKLCRQEILAGRAIVLLDGLDEVGDSRLRGRVSLAIGQFIARHISNGAGFASHKETEREGLAGNQIVITSRITGYHLAPLLLEEATHYRISPLTEDAVKRLCQRMGRVLDVDEGYEGIGERFYEVLQAQSAANPALEKLRLNPLLLTSMFVYFVGNQFQLPPSRAALYKRLVIDLARNWRLEGTQRGEPLVLTPDEKEAWPKLQGVLTEDDQLLRLLSEIARYIHDEGTGGRIARPAFRVELQRLLSLIFNVRKTEVGWRLAQICTDLLLRLISQDVGVLVELGQDVFGFVHLTFQEYLAGVKLLHWPEKPEPAELRARFIAKMHDPRWREPLLLAFSSLATANTPNNERERLNLIRQIRGDSAEMSASSGASIYVSNDEKAQFLTELLREVPPDCLKDAELREVLLVLLDAYGRCGVLPSQDLRRWRLAEKIASLRRILRERVDHLLKAILSECDDPAPLAHLLWSRYWLPIEILKIFLDRQKDDSPKWGWPIQTALRQSLSENQHLQVAPAKMQARPSEDERAKALYDLGVEIWKQRYLASLEWDLQALPDHLLPPKQWLLSNPKKWDSLSRNPRMLRLMVAALQCVDDINAIGWSHEYRGFARFLGRGNSYRDAQILSNAEQFIWRWGAGDVVYSIAVYLDTDPDGRFKRRTKTPRIGPDLISDADGADLEAWLVSVTKPWRMATSRITSYPVRSCKAVSLALGEPIEPLLTSRDLWEVQRVRASLRDAAFRGAWHFPDWLGLNSPATAPSLEDAEAALLFRHCVRIVVSASAMPGPVPRTSRDGSRLSLAAQANCWAAGFVGSEVDPVYDFALLIESMAPNNTGIFGPLSLLNAILASPVLKLLPKLQGLNPGLWGLSPEERVVPPVAFEAIAVLAEAADEIRTGFATVFAQAFLVHLPSEGFCGCCRKSIGSLFQLPDFALESSLQHDVLAEMAINNLPTEDPKNWATKLTSPFDTATELEFLMSRGLLAPKHYPLVEALADHLGQQSWTDRCLFLARMASYNASESQRWLQLGIAGVDEIEDWAVRAEFLHRIRPALHHDHLDVFAKAVRRLAREKPLLAAYAERKLASYLCHESFAWNRSSLTATNPSWVITSIYGALDEALQHTETDSRWTSLWSELHKHCTPQAVSALIEQAGSRGIPCTQDAARVLTSLIFSDTGIRQNDEAALRRLVTLLEHSTPASLPYLRVWGRARKQATPLSKALRIQATLMLAEQNRSLSGICLTRLLAGYETDDFVRIRCSNMLAGPVTDAEREERRFSLSTSDSRVLVRLARLGCKFPRIGSLDTRRVIGLTFYNWNFDDPSVIREWCHCAMPGNLHEALLVTALEWTDVWSEECQHEIVTWALSEASGAGDQRYSAIVHFVARLVYLKKYQAASRLLDSLQNIPPSAAIRTRRCFPDADRKSVYSLVAEACRRTADQPNRTGDYRSQVSGGEGAVARVAHELLESWFVPIFPGGGEGGPATAPMAALGSLRYHFFFEKPEDCIELIANDISNENFANALLSWTEDCLDRAPLKIGMNEDDRILEALLSFATCLSARRPDFFARHANPEIWIPRLGRVCLSSTWQRSRMAAVTLISRLKKINLDMPVASLNNSEPANHTLLDCLLHVLRGTTELQDRLTQLLPRLPELQGLWRAVYKLLSDPNSSGTVMVAAAQLLRSMLNGNSIDLNDRQEASRLLGQLPTMTIHHRPLYRLAGSGKTDDPVFPLYCGDLAEALARVS
ncbi:MAG TPA: TIR domain-containing protein [Candidatus Angelobacter sp.]|jgi:hypothetical protein|nr:TIR domain-containing protein [Candidatus Angelobacter sp.]